MILGELEHSELTKSEIIDKSVATFVEDVIDQPFWYVALRLFDLWAAWSLLWLEVWANDKKLDVSDYEDQGVDVMLAYVWSEFNCAASMNSGPFNAYDFRVLCVSLNPRNFGLFYFEDCNY